MILERLFAERRESSVHARRVSLGQRAFRCITALHGRTRHRAKAMDPRRAIGRERRRANQFGQLTRGSTPQQIHLKKTLLRMNPT